MVCIYTYIRPPSTFHLNFVRSLNFTSLEKLRGKRREGDAGPLMLREDEGGTVAGNAAPRRKTKVQEVKKAKVPEEAVAGEEEEDEVE